MCKGCYLYNSLFYGTKCLRFQLVILMNTSSFSVAKENVVNRFCYEKITKPHKNPILGFSAFCESLRDF